MDMPGGAHIEDGLASWVKRACPASGPVAPNLVSRAVAAVGIHGIEIALAIVEVTERLGAGQAHGSGAGTRAVHGDGPIGWRATVSLGRVRSRREWLRQGRSPESRSSPSATPFSRSVR